MNDATQTWTRSIITRVVYTHAALYGDYEGITCDRCGTPLDIGDSRLQRSAPGMDGVLDTVCDSVCAKGLETV